MSDQPSVWEAASAAVDLAVYVTAVASALEKLSPAATAELHQTITGHLDPHADTLAWRDLFRDDMLATLDRLDFASAKVQAKYMFSAGYRPLLPAVRHALAIAEEALLHVSDDALEEIARLAGAAPEVSRHWARYAIDDLRSLQLRLTDEGDKP